ncbi:MAG TPA: GTPase HflX, partial [Methylococcaceae bacterium]|nr:GTPase HflX [Methylococcaceae bacterium]
RRRFHLDSSKGGLRARLFEIALVLKDEADGVGGWDMEIEIPQKDERYLRDYGVSVENLNA